VRLWDAEKGSLSGTIEAGGAVGSGIVNAWTLSFRPDGAALASGASSGEVNLWDVATLAKASSFATEPKGDVDADTFIMSVAHAPADDGNLVAAAGYSGAVGVYDRRTGKICQSYVGHHGPVRSLCWARNGDALLSASDDGTVRAWDMGSPGEPFWTFYANRSWCLSVRCAPDGTHFCTTGADREVKFWSLDTKEELSRVEGHEDQVWEVAYSPDGSELASVSDDGNVRFYSRDSHDAHAAANLASNTAEKRKRDEASEKMEAEIAAAARALDAAETTEEVPGRVIEPPPAPAA